MKRTNVVTGVDISGHHVADNWFFKPLVKATAENFTIREVSADKAYHGRPNMELVESVGGTAGFARKNVGSALLCAMFAFLCSACPRLSAPG